MSALTIAIKTLRAGTGVTAIVGERIYPVAAPQNAGYPNVVVHVIHQAEDTLLQGATQWPLSRISVECRESSLNNDNPVPTMDRLAEAVVDWLRDKHLYIIDGCEVEFQKEGSDETDFSENVTNGYPTVFRRIIDFYLRARRI